MRVILFGQGVGSAFAADPTPSNAQYGRVAGGSAGGGQHVVGAGAGGSLPFTGANLIVYVGAGLGMVGAGIALRRTAGRKRPISHR